jgi:phospholipid/cholesterol/gamma-HCH transport system substrate-binding protein
MVVRLVAALLALTLVGGCGFSLQNAPTGRDVDGDSYRITAHFDDVTGLPVGGKVRLGAADVGRVHSLRAEDFVALVDINMRSDVELPQGTRAELELSTALGDQFIALKVPDDHGDEMIRPGGTIPLSDTHKGPDIEDTMAQFANVLHNSGIDQARTIVTELNTMLDGREGKARELLGRADTILESLTNRIDDFNATLAAVNELGETVNANTDMLEEALVTIGPAIDVLREQQGNFDALLESVGELSTEVNRAIDKTEDTLASQLRKLGPIVDALADADADIGETLSLFNTFQPLFNRAVPGDYVNLYGLANVPDSVIGVLEGGPEWLGGGGGSTSGEAAVEELLKGMTR